MIIFKLLVRLLAGRPVVANVTLTEYLDGWAIHREGDTVQAYNCVFECNRLVRDGLTDQAVEAEICYSYEGGLFLRKSRGEVS